MKEESSQARCRHVPLCGGCTLQQIPYEEQLKQKEERIYQLFGKKPSPILPSPCTFRYRNKMEFTFSQDKKGEKFLGLMMARSRGRVFHLTECHLAPSWMAHLLFHIRLFWEKSTLKAYRFSNDTGSLRTVTMREGKRTQDKMIILTVSGNPEFALSKKQIDSFVQEVLSAFPEKERSFLTIFLRIQQIHKGKETQFFELHLFGKDHIRERIFLKNRALEFKISPTSFFQPNTTQAEALYNAALSLPTFPKKRVLDLYAGTATLGLTAALYAEQVLAIEINPHACFDAEVNKELNQIENLEIVCGDVGAVLASSSCLPDWQIPDLILVDPPRSGLGVKVTSLLAQIGAPEILYISCNPSTQAIDAQALISSGYTIVAIQPVDQFPHTLHIENILFLRKE